MYTLDPIKQKAGARSLNVIFQAFSHFAVSAEAVKQLRWQIYSLQAALRSRT